MNEHNAVILKALSLAHAKHHFNLDMIRITPMFLLKLLMVGFILVNYSVLQPE